MLSTLLQKLINNCPLFDQPCVLCSSRSATHGLCYDCTNDLPQLPTPHCLRCALPSINNNCQACSVAPGPLDALHAAFLFGYPLDSLLHAFKYRKKLELANVLGTLLHQKIGAIPANFDAAIAVPLSKERLAERGFNQSEELLFYLTNPLQRRSLKLSCWRKYNTAPQASLNLQQRQQNMCNAFGVKQSVKGLSIAIIDDVATTLATLSALALALKNQGAKRVEAWVLARALTTYT